MWSVEWRELLTSKGWAKYSSVGWLSSLASLIKRLTPILDENNQNNTTNYLIWCTSTEPLADLFFFSEPVRTVFIPPRIDTYLDFVDYILLPSPNWSEKGNWLMKQSNLYRTFHFHFPNKLPSPCIRVEHYDQQVSEHTRPSLPVVYLSRNVSPAVLCEGFFSVC